MIAPSLTLTVQRRARQRCEYCCMHQSLQGATFHVEHIVPLSRGGASAPENLAWCCPSCNLHKSDRTHAVDPETNQLERSTFSRSATSWIYVSSAPSLI